MSTTELKIPFPTEKLDALRFIGKKDQTIEHELEPPDTYEDRPRPCAGVCGEPRRYGTVAGSVPEAAERAPACPSRRQREQAAAVHLRPDIQLSRPTPSRKKPGMTMGM